MLEALFSKINRSTIVWKKRKVEDANPYLEDFDEESNIWKRIFHLPSEPIWYNSLLIMGIYNMATAFINATMTTVYQEYIAKIYDMFYLCDLCWFVNIVLTITSQRLSNLKTSLVAPPRRSYAMFALEIISVLPLEIFAQDPYVKYFLALNRILKIFHVIFMFNYINSMIKASILGRVFQLFYLMTYLILLLTMILSYIICYYTPYFCRSEKGSSHVIYLITVVTDHISTKGFGLLAREYYLGKFILIVSSFMVFIGVFCMYTAYITFYFFAKAVHKSNFRYKLSSLTKYLKGNDSPQEFINCVDHFFDKMWSVCDGYEGYMAETRWENKRAHFKHILPRAMQIEIQTDICYGAFAHSALFKGAPVAFLRDLATVMRQQVYISGQYVFHSDEVKDKMIYVFSGIIQIISEEDGETPLISLGDGTCLAETSLILPYKSSFKVQCLNTAVLQVLERKDFLKIASKYPPQYKEINSMVMKRYDEALALHKVKNIVNYKASDLLQQCLSTMWINFTLHKVMGSKDFDSARKHAIQNIYIQNNINSYTFKNYLFSARYLSLLAIIERVQVNSDTLFIRSTFPHILRPNTGLVLFWDIFIAIMALIAGIQIPMISFVRRGKLATFYGSIYALTMLWWVDVVVKLRTAVELRHGIVTKSLDILSQRITDLGFILDIVCCIPFEFCSSILVYKSIEDLVYINRMLKLIRVFQLLGKWEMRYNSNPLIVRICSVSLMLFYGCYFLGCVYFSIECLNECDNKEVSRLIFYACQILTGVAMWVPGYSELQSYNSLNIILFVGVSILFSILYGMVFSAYAFNELYRLNLQYATLKFIMVAKNVHHRHVQRISQHVCTQVTICNGLNFFNNGYAFNNLPKPLLGFFFQRLYIEWLVTLPVFQDLPKYIVIDVLQSAAYVVNLSPGETIFHVGDLLDDLIILAAGFCEKVSSSGLCLELIAMKVALNDLEICLSIPCRNTIVTLTHCDLIKVNFVQMRKVLLKYCKHSHMEGVMFNMKDIRKRFLLRQIIQPRAFHYNYKYEQKFKAFIVHKRSDPMYFRPFFEAKCSCVRHLLLNFTFIPDGKFVLIWEYVRSFCAIMSSLLYPTTMLIFLPLYNPLMLFMYFLDFMAWLDLYIRPHMCYYDSRGILITHPLSTSSYYFNNGFLIDFIGALPLQFLVNKNKYIILNINKLLQLHRYISLIKVKESNSVLPVSKYYMFKFLPLLIILLNIASSIFVAANCEFIKDPVELDAYNFVCDRTSVFYMNRMTKPLTALRAHLYAFYVIVSTVSTISIQGFVILDGTTMIIISVLSIFGFYWNTLVSASIFGYYINDHLTLIYNDVRLQHLYRFMNLEKVRHSLLKHVDKYLRRCWFMEKLNVHGAMENFPKYIQRDILYDRFAPSLICSCLVGADDFDPFIRNVLMHTTYSIIDKNGYVVTINDVLDETIIIFSGVIEIVGPDGVVMLSLRPGSIVGNLCYMKYNRMLISVVAIGTVELLKIKTLKFVELLQYFSQTEAKFLRLRSIHYTHIPGYSDFNYVKKSSETSNYVVPKYSFVLFCIGMVFLFFGAYFSQMLYFYQIAVSEFSPYFIGVQVVSDLFYLISLSFDFFIVINDGRGLLRNLQDIRKYWFRQKFFWIALVGGIPFDYVLYFLALPPRVSYYSFVVLRMNVTLRNFHFVPNFNRHNSRFKTRMFVSKLFMTIIVITLVLFGATSMIMVACEITFENMNEFINRDELLEATSLFRFQQFVIWFYVISNTFTHTSQFRYFPIGWFYVVLVTIVMFFMMIYLSVFYSTIISMVQATRQMKWKYISMLNHLYSYMFHYEASVPMTERVSFYASVIWKNMSGLKYPELLHEVPPYLREVILMSALGNAIDCHPLFGKCHIDFRRQLYAKIKFDYYYHGDFVQYKGAVDNTMYWVHRGELVSLSEVEESRDDIVSKFTAGSCFGVPQGIYQIPHVFSYRAISDVCVLHLEKEDWEYLMAFFPASKVIIYEQGSKIRSAEDDIIKKINKIPV